MKKRIISVRVTEEEYSIIQMKANAFNESPSTYMRNCTLKSKQHRENSFSKTTKPIIRNMQTSFNMIEQNIDVENQKNLILQEAKNLCYKLS